MSVSLALDYDHQARRPAYVGRHRKPIRARVRRRIAGVIASWALPFLLTAGAMLAGLAAAGHGPVPA